MVDKDQHLASEEFHETVKSCEHAILALRIKDGQAKSDPCTADQTLTLPSKDVAAIVQALREHLSSEQLDHIAQSISTGQKGF